MINKIDCVHQYMKKQLDNIACSFLPEKTKKKKKKKIASSFMQVCFLENWDSVLSTSGFFSKKKLSSSEFIFFFCFFLWESIHLMSKWTQTHLKNKIAERIIGKKTQKVKNSGFSL